MNTQDVDATLPEGWAAVPLGEIVRPSNVNVHPSERPTAAYLSLEHMESDTGRIIGHGIGADATSNKVLFHAGDVLYGRLRPYLNKVCVPDFDGICSTDILVFPETPAVLSRLLEIFLRQTAVVHYANSHSSGIQLPRINFAHLADLIVYLPPLREQRRIVARTEALLSTVHSVTESLSRVETLLTDFRQSILVAACSGRLTEQRTGHQRSDSVEALLDQIASEHGTERPRVSVDKSIPEGWRRVTLGFLAQPTLRSKPYITSGSRGWAKYTSTKGHYFIRSENINTDCLRLSDAVRVEPPSSAETQRTEVRPGDLLLTITGNNVGRTAVVPSDCPRAFVSQHVAIIRLHERIVADYLWIWMRSRKHGFAQLEASWYGETKPGLNLEQLKSVWVDLPPVAEQREIVRRVEALFKLADGIERCVTAARLRADGLRQAILTRAFRGELVSTEADLARTEGRDYETGDQLLVRVREETKNSPVPTRKKEKPAMQKRRLDRPTVEQTIRAMPRDRFGFDELLAEFPADYEPLKEILFKLLDDSASGLLQVFDEESRAIQFERRQK